MPTLAYCGTLNNYTAEDVAILRTPNSKLQYFIAGHEIAPTTNTPHLQLYFQLAKQTKITTIKGWGGPWARMKLIPPNGSDEENYNYCRKIRPQDPIPNEVWFEHGERKPMGKKGARNDLSQAVEAIRSGISERNLLEQHSNVMARYSRFIDRYRDIIQNDDAKEFLKAKFSTWVLYPWQQHIVDMVASPANDRSINWIWSEAGNLGKSSFATYLSVHHQALVLEAGKKNDILHIFSKNPAPIVIFDLVKATKDDEIRHLYGIAESFKNGRIMSGKYDGKTIFFRPPHLIFFTNFPPDESLWSADRLNVMKLD